MTLIYPIALGRTGMIGKPTDFPILPVGGAAEFVGAFDAIANLVHVWCIARRWRSDYAGRLVRFRRSSDNAELDFTYDADGNLDVAAVAAWAGGSAFVVVVADQVSADDVSQGTAGNQPLYVASGQNSRPVGRYNGTSHWLRGAFTSGGALSQPYTTYAITKYSGSFPAPTLIALDSDDTTNRMLLFISSGSFAMSAGASLTWSNASSNAYHLFSLLYNSTSSQAWQDGVSKATGNAGTQNADGITIGARFDGGAQWWNGDIATVAIADPSHDTTARQAVEAALDNYWDTIP